jgi:flagellar hook-associated protein 2
MGVISPGSDAYISIGNSYVSTIRNYLDSLLSSSGILTTRTNSLNKELTDYNTELDELDVSIEKSRERYKKQYGAMESVVNSFKSTGEFLDNYMEAQNKD